MADDIAHLAVRVDSTDVKRADDDLDRFTKAGDKAEKSAKGVGKATDKMGGSFKGAIDPMQRVKLLLGGISTALVARQIINYSDAWESANNQLRLVSESTEELSLRQKALLEISNDTRSAFGSTATLYARLKQSTTELEVADQELLTVTKAINQSIKAFGGDAASADAAIIQLSQGLASGALRGDEFNSVAEQAPGIMDAIAEHTGKTRGELRDFAAEGKITSEIVVESLLAAADTIENQFNSAVATNSDKMTVAKNNVMAYVGASDIAADSVAAWGDTLVFLSENIDTVMQIAGLAATVIGAQYVPAILSAAAANARAATTIGLLGGPIGATITLLGTLAIAYDRVRQRVDEARESVFQLNTQTMRSTELSMVNVVARMREVNEELRSVSGNSNEALAKGQELSDEYNDLERQLERLAKTYGEQRAALVESSKDTKQLRHETDNLVHSLRSLNGELPEAGSGVLNLSTQAANAAAEFDLLDGKLFDAERTMERLTFRVFEHAGATGELSSETETLGSTSSGVSQAMQRDWERNRDVISDGFIDIALNGGDAFDVIDNAWKRLLAGMVSDFAASGVLELFGMPRPGFSSSPFNVPGFSGGSFPAGSGGSMFSIGLSGIDTGIVNPFDPTTTLQTQGNVFANLGAGIAGSFVGNELGQGIFGKEAESNIGATVGGFAGSFFGPNRS
jgi:tape measure domain-containing protein